MSDQQKTSIVQIKGLKDGLLVTFGEADWLECLKSLENMLQEKESFFRGAQVTLDLGGHVLRAPDLNILADLISQKGLVLKSISGKSPSTMMNIRMLGFDGEGDIETTSGSITAGRIPGEEPILLKKTLRSGYRIVSVGHVIVIGDVNAGAEIIAGGNIVIWGKAFGVLQAGHPANPDAVICALQLNPQLLRIGGVPASIEQELPQVQSVMVSNKLGRIRFEAWHSTN